MSNDIEQTLDEAFPKVDPLMTPYGGRVLVQLRAVKEKVTAAGLYIPEETKETEKWEDGQEYPLVKLDISMSSHPFYTGKQVLVDTAGRVDKFRSRYSKKK